MNTYCFGYRRVLLAAAVLVLASCQTIPYKPYARDVKKKPGQGGVIAVTINHKEEDMPRANELMAANCGEANPKVVEEGEVVTGTETHETANRTHDYGSSGTQVGTLFGMPVTSSPVQPSNTTNTHAVTTAQKEWQLTYECQKAAPVATSPAVPIVRKKRTAKAKTTTTSTSVEE